MAAATYDGGWHLDYVHVPGAPGTLEPGVFLGNGKLGLLTGFDGGVGVARTVTSMPPVYYGNAALPGVMDAFGVCRVRPFGGASDGAVETLVSQSLDMQHGIFTSVHGVDKGGVHVDVTSRICVLRQAPFCVLQSVSITAGVTGVAAMDLFHDVSAGGDLLGVTFNNNAVYLEGAQALVLSGRAKKIHGRPVGTEMAVACTYVYEGAGTLSPGGFGANDGGCYNRFAVTGLAPGAVATLHIVSAILTSRDTALPLDEAKRTVLNLGASGAAAIAGLWAAHSAAWERLWSTDVVIAPKAGITGGEAAALALTQRTLRVCLYNIYASVREDGGSEVDALGATFVDLGGGVVWDGDLWLVPVLVMAKPVLARALIENRFRALEAARKVAASYGYKGALYPFMPETNTNAAQYWTAGPMAIFNTALVAWSAWNYYRVTKDRWWLGSKGFPMLKDIADFLAAKAVRDLDGTWHMRGVIGVGGDTSADNHALTVALAKLALLACIEAARELEKVVETSWTEAMAGLQVPYWPPDPYVAHVVKYDAGAGATDTYSILDPLFALVPYYAKVFYAPELNHSPGVSVPKNLAFYGGAATPGMAAHPYNMGLLTLLKGIAAQSDATGAAAATYRDALAALVAGATTPSVWGHLAPFGQSGAPCDMATCAVVLLAVLQGVGGLNVSGGVAEGRFYYEDMKLVWAARANLPKTWKGIRMTGVGGGEGVSATVTNTLTYP